MSWRRRMPGLEKRLDAAGVDARFTVVQEMPVAGYVVMTALPTAIVGGFIIAAQRSSGGVIGVALAMAAVVGITLHWTRAAVVLAGDDWVARHTIFRWRFVRLDRLGKVDSYVSTAAGALVWLRLWDTEGDHVALNARATVPRMRPLLSAYVGRAMAAGVPVDSRAVQIVGL